MYNSICSSPAFEMATILKLPARNFSMGGSSKRGAGLALPAGDILATNNVINAPCCDVFYLEKGKVKAFHCYTAGTILLGQIGALANLSAAIKK